MVFLPFSMELPYLAMTLAQGSIVKEKIKLDVKSSRTGIC